MGLFLLLAILVPLCVGVVSILLLHRVIFAVTSSRYW